MKDTADPGSFTFPGKSTRNTLVLLSAGFALLAVTVGIYARLKGLDKFPLATDEYYTLKSVENILQYGVPRHETGGYYLRGILYQYIVAAFIMLGGEPVYTLRLTAVLSNIAAFPAIYILGRMAGGRLVGLLAMIMFSLSLWEMELSRFGRMYAPFQMIFLYYLICMIRVIETDDKRHYVLLFILALLGLLTWEGGLLLFLGCFVPQLIKRERYGYGWLLTTAVISGIAYLYFNVKLGPSPEENLPEAWQNVSPPLQRPWGPIFLFATLPANIPWLILCSGIAAYAMWVMGKIWRATGTDALVRLGWILTIIASFLNQFLIVAYLFVAMYLAGMHQQLTLSSAPYRRTLQIVMFWFAFWMIYGLSTSQWHGIFPPFPDDRELYKLLVILFKYPNIFDSMIFPWLEAMPSFSIVSFLALLSLVILSLFHRRVIDNQPLRIVILILITFIMVIGTERTLYTETRYTFFVMPVMFVMISVLVLLLCESVMKKLQWAQPTAFLITPLLFFSTDDFSFAHIRNIDTPPYNYRTVYDEAKASHYYPRHDFRGPAEYVNRRLARQDLVIILDLPFEYYLDRVDYVYVNIRHTEFRNRSRHKGTREKWTGARLIYQHDRLLEVINNHTGKIWLIMSAADGNEFEKAITELYHDCMRYRGEDHVYAVYEIGPSKRCDRVALLDRNPYSGLD